jgi:hypothetical protein
LLLPCLPFFGYFYTIILLNKKAHNMKKLMTIAVATLLVSGAAFAGGKECAKGKSCCKKENAEGKKDAACCKKDDKAKAKDEKPAAAPQGAGSAKPAAPKA